MIRGGAAPLEGAVVDRQSFSDVLLGNCAVDSECPILHSIYVIDAVSANDVPLKNLGDTSYPMGSYPQNIHFWDVNGDFQLKRLRA
jgi:hypothetical protein